MSKIPFAVILLAILIGTAILMTLSVREGFGQAQEYAPKERKYPLIPMQPMAVQCYT
jgi:hypothetical protein